jgi:hypothetical protein
LLPSSVSAHDTLNLIKDLQLLYELPVSDSIFQLSKENHKQRHYYIHPELSTLTQYAVKAEIVCVKFLLFVWFLKTLQFFRKKAIGISGNVT